MFLSLLALAGGLAFGINEIGATMSVTRMNDYESDPYNPNIYLRVSLPDLEVDDATLSFNLTYEEVTGDSVTIPNFIYFNYDYDSSSIGTLDLYVHSKDYTDYPDYSFPQINYVLYYRIWYRNSQIASYTWSPYAEPIYLWHDYSESDIHIDFINAIEDMTIEFQFHYLDSIIYQNVIDGYGGPDGENYNIGYQAGEIKGFADGYESGKQDGYQNGYSEGRESAIEQGATASIIFNGIISVGLLPVNVFLRILNFEVFGINIGAFVSSLLTIAVVIIIVRMFTGGKGSDN